MPPQPPHNLLEELMARFVEEVMVPQMNEIFDRISSLHRRSHPRSSHTKPPKSPSSRKAMPFNDNPKKRRPNPGTANAHPRPVPQRLRVTLYDVLEVSPKASADVIAAAYRSLAKRHHPDVSKSKHAVEEMKIINQAFSVLKDAERRAAYDRSIGL